MKRKITKLMAALALLAFLAVPMGMRGQTNVTWPGTTALPGTATAVANDQNVTIMVSSTNTYSNPIRIYANTTVTINALNNAKILSVAYEASSTGNYVTYAQEATVTPNVTPTVSGKIVTWTYAESANVTEFTFKPSSQTRSNGITITYIMPGANPTCATPTFNPAAGTYTSAQTVTINCSTEGATIYYTTDGNDPTTSSTVYSDPINVSSDMTIKAMATAEGYDNSAVATAEYAFITLEHAGTLADPYNVADAHAAIDANAGTQGVYATGIVSAIPTAYDSGFGNITFDLIDEEGDEVFLRAYRCGGDEAANVAVGDVAVVYGNLTKYGQTYEFAQDCQLVSLTHQESTEPSITVTPTTVNFAATGTEGFQMENLTIAYANIEVTNFESFTVQFYDNQGNETEMSWLVAGVTGSNAEGYVVRCVAGDNDGEARTAYFKVYAYDAENNKVYSELVTVTQAEYVAPTYAELPFSFNSGKADIEETDGLYQGGLGDDYNATNYPNTQLKFDGTGDWLLLQFDERPGTLTFSIKNNSFSGGTFTVQTSEDGVTYTDLETYTEITGTQSEEFTDLGENVRYIKWVYTNKVSGNVGLGNIALDAYEVPVIGPSITVTPDNYELDANAHSVEYLTTLAYENIVIVPESTGNFGIQYCDAEGNPTEHSWCGVSVSAVENSDDFQLLLILATANDGNEARTAYFKVFGHDAEDNVVYSNLVTITQAAPVIDYAVLPFEWAGGASADFLALNGVTAYNLGSDYATGNAPYLIKFDGTGDYIQVKCDQQPGKVTIGVKMIGGGNTSNITIQGSADGETFTDIETLTISGASNNILTLETTNAFDDNDRYVRMVFTKGSNVGVGPITIEKGNAPSITVTPSTVDLEAAGQVGETGYQMQSLTVTYNNLEITQAHDFAVQFYNAEGEEQTQPSWIEPDPTVVSGGNDLGYMVMLMIAPNEGPARSAYFKVSALDADSNPVYSNLVTINQAAPNYATLPFEFNGGKNGIDNTIGLTYEGLGSDYNATSNPTTKLKFDSTDDCLILKLNEAPTSLSYDIKGNNFDGSTFTVQTSADGETYFDLATYGNAQLASGSLTSITHLDLASDVRYIKWIYTNKSGGNVGLGNIHASADYDIYGNVTVANLTIPANKTCTIYNGAVLNVTGTLTNEATENAWEHLVIKDGAQLKTPNEVKGTVEKNITGYGTTGKDNYVLLASPATIDACNSTGMWYHGQHADVDFYYFDQSREGEEWRNFKYGNTIFTGPYCMQQGQGFLYADKNDNTLTLQTRGYVAPNVDYQEHPFAPTNTPISVGVSYTAGKLFSGFNLVGNPFTCTAYLADGRDFYRMNANGNAIVLAEDNAINVCEGVFVVTTAAENTVTFTTAVPATAVNGGNIDLSLTQNHGALIDNARIRFGEGAAMPKMVFGGNSRIYFAQGNQDYAVVRSNAQGEMPVNFKAENNGTYTLSIDSKNVEMNYLHLIDNITGADVDLLAEPSYSFEARTSDYASRFRLVFSANSNVEDNSEASFAYYNGSEWVLNNMGNATLQVIDITGRVLSSETISGNASISLNQTPGVYMLRLINSDSVRTQKIVVK